MKIIAEFRNDLHGPEFYLINVYKVKSGKDYVELH